MLSQDCIPIGKLKQAYDLNAHEAEALLSDLSPGRVFPFAVWQKAHAKFWRLPAEDKARLYKLESPPQFPEVGEIPEKYFPTVSFAQWIVDFLTEMSKLISIENIEKGFDYVIDETYDGDAFPFKHGKESLIYTLNVAEKSIRNTTAVPIREKDYSIARPYFKFIFDFFPDTVPVDKVAAVLYLHYYGYSLRREVKGLSHALVESIIAEASVPPVHDDAPETPSPSIIIVPRVLWENKSPKSVRDSMRQQDFPDPVIAYVLYNWCDLKNMTEIGKLIALPGKNPSTHLRLTHRLLAKAALLNIQHA
jgi:hypothetical protein